MASADSHKRLSVVTQCAVGVLLIVLSLFGQPAGAQDLQSQRQLPAPSGPQLPLDQLRLMIQHQMLRHPQKMPSARQIQDRFNLSDEQFRSLREAVKRSGMTSQGRPRRPIPQTNAPSDNPIRQLQELKHALESSEPTSSDPSEPGRFAAPPAGGQSQGSGTGTRRSAPPGRLPANLNNIPFEPAESGRRFRAADQTERFPGARRGDRQPAELPEMSERSGSGRLNSNRSGLPGQGTSLNRSDGLSFDIGDELSRRGLQRTLGRVVRDIRRKVQEDGAVTGGGSSSERSALNQAIFRVLDSVREDAVDTVRESRRSRSARSASSRRTRSRQNGQGSPTDRRAEVAAGDRAAAAESRQSGIPESEIPSLPDMLPSAESLSAPGSLTQLLILLAGAGVMLAIYLVSSRRQSQAESRRRQRALKAIKPDRIRTREDVIQAFHWLTHCQSPDAAEWWNHLEAGESLAQQSPARQESVRQLIHIYELARYQPEDVEFEPAHVQQARTAVAGCLP